MLELSKFLSASAISFALLSNAWATPLLDINASVGGSAEDAISGSETFFFESPPDALPLFGEALSDLADATASVDSLNETLSFFTAASLEGAGQAQALAVVSAFVLAPGSPGTPGPLDFLLHVDIDTSMDVFGVVDVFSELNILIQTTDALVLDEAFALSNGQFEFERRFQLNEGEDAMLTFALSTSVLGNGAFDFGQTLTNTDVSVRQVALIQDVPEPAALALVGLGLGLVALFAQRRPIRRHTR